MGLPLNGAAMQAFLPDPANLQMAFCHDSKGQIRFKPKEATSGRKGVSLSHRGMR